MTVGDILKKYRKKNHISQDKFSEKSGISKGYISMLENNKNARDGKPIAPTLEMLQKLSIGMEIELDELMKLVDGKQKISLTSEAATVKTKDIRLQKIIDCYNSMDDVGKDNLAEQAEFILGKYPNRKKDTGRLAI